MIMLRRTRGEACYIIIRRVFLFMRSGAARRNGIWLWIGSEEKR